MSKSIDFLPENSLVEVKVTYKNITFIKVFKYLIFTEPKYQKSFYDIKCTKVLKIQVKVNAGFKKASSQNNDRLKNAAYITFEEKQGRLHNLKDIKKTFDLQG